MSTERDVVTPASLPPGVTPLELSALLNRKALERYLAGYFMGAVRITDMRPLGVRTGAKGFGYGVPVLLRLDGAPVEAVVLHFAATGGFGHDTLTDRAVEALQPYDTFNSFEDHVPALDVGVLGGDGSLRSLGEVRDFFYVTGYAPGEPYFRDLERIAKDDNVSDGDLYRVDALVDVLARNHAHRKDAPELYRRRVRDLFGHHECIAGLVDSYDEFEIDDYTSPHELIEIEQRGVMWRHQHKHYPHRLCQVHGDFHPWNVLFDSRDRVVLLDRTRGEWGEPADDVACMAINYLFFSLRRDGRLGGSFARLWHRFFEGYIAATGDLELCDLLPPYLCWRALVLASPLWYPNLETSVRKTLFRLIRGLLTVERFDWRGVNQLVHEAA